MKLFAIAAAAAVAITSFSAVPASAQRERVVRQTTVTRHVNSRHVNYRHGVRHRGWRTKRVCTTRWHHHRRVRVCRTIRVRR